MNEDDLMLCKTAFPGLKWHTSSDDESFIFTGVFTPIGISKKEYVALERYTDGYLIVWQADRTIYASLNQKVLTASEALDYIKDVMVARACQLHCALYGNNA